MAYERLTTFFMVSALSLTACGGELDTHDEPTDDAPLAQETPMPPDRPFKNQKPFSKEGLPPVKPAKSFTVPSDPDVSFIAKNGMGGIHFLTCVSKATGQPDITSPTKLPVGNGRYLECKTDHASSLAPAMAMMTVQSRKGARYCFSGSAKEYRTGADPRLTVEQVNTPASGPWVLKLTSKEAWQVERVQGGWGSVWPIWLEINYAPVQMTPARPTDTCELL